jgi:hypothetical protein
VQEINNVGWRGRLNRAQAPILAAEEYQRLAAFDLIFM